MTYDVGFMNARLRAQGNTLVFADHDASFFLGNRSWHSDGPPNHV